MRFPVLFALALAACLSVSVGQGAALQRPHPADVFHGLISDLHQKWQALVDPIVNDEENVGEYMTTEDPAKALKAWKLNLPKLGDDAEALLKQWEGLKKDLDKVPAGVEARELKVLYDELGGAMECFLLWVDSPQGDPQRFWFFAFVGKHFNYDLLAPAVIEGKYSLFEFEEEPGPPTG